MVQVRKLLISAMIIGTACLTPGTALRSMIGKAVANKMPEIIGQADSYTADVNGDIVDIALGKLEKVDIHGKGVKMANGMVVNRLDISLTDVHFKLDQTITKVKSTNFKAQVIEDDLNNWLATARPDLRNAHITLNSDKLTVTAKPKVMLLRTPVKAEGALQIVDQTKLYMALDKFSTRGIKVPGMVRGHIEHDINPVFDTEQLGIGAKLKSVRILNGAITITGTADANKVIANQ